MGSDRISGLPNDLRAAIISYLPFKEAVRSSLLSRAWRDVWTGMIRLNLRSEKRHYYEYHGTHRATRLVQQESVSSRLNLAGIRSLSLSDLGPPPKARWHLGKRGRVEDEVDGSEQRGLFGEFLEVLELSRCKLTAAGGIPFQKCTNLKTLELFRVSMEAHVLEHQLFPNCMLLENLCLRSSIIKTRGRGLPASRPVAWSASARLKSLKLYEVRLATVTAVSIKAPGLTNLTLDHFSLYYSLPYKFEFDMSKFSFALEASEIVTLQIRGTTVDGQSCDPKSRLTSARLFELLTRHQNIGDDHKAGVDIQFPKLQCLSTDLDLKDTRDAALLCRFLKLCHQLKRLYITTHTNKEEKQGTSSDQYCCHSHLPMPMPWISIMQREA